jgi:hypothetical protein
MVKELLRREYQTYETKEAEGNLLYWLQMDEVFEGYPGMLSPKNEEIPSEKDLDWWTDQFLFYTEAGQKLLSVVGAPLHKQNPENEEDDWPLDEWTLSDRLESLTYPSEWDSEGPSLHSQFSNPNNSED